ncbi:related to dehydrogenase [Cephalotrichum gorgonifer]|uniref:Related to dehydrogenase n=1 Tax=Cephalotrichum gorgonifer TaxID=2041049 RepID=A0AAE8SZR3_9PEZI|nr:related to dehydrogenase [Cephalotrichum gorgonifer]
MPKVLDLAETFSKIPAPITPNTKNQVQAALTNPQSRVPILVALDDDPTGTQTCNNISILMTWEVDVLASELKSTPAGGGFFILTNSRALPPHAAEVLMAQICTNLRDASAAAGVPVEVVLRGDSTLRGHFPLEVDVTQRVLGAADACILCPFFSQGGRYTIDDVHYVAEGEKLVPAALTPFAMDASFGYKSSNLRDYVEEKTGGRIKRDAVVSLSLDMIRRGGVDTILQRLKSVPKGSVVIANATTDEDVDVVVLAALTAAAEGRRFIYRTGASFVSARLGIIQIPAISPRTLNLAPNIGGLVIAGSYVPKTTAQLKTLTQGAGDRLTTIEIQVDELLNHSRDVINDAIKIAEREISQGQDALIMTSRKVVVGTDMVKSLEIGAVIAEALVEFLVGLEAKPRYIIAKGGITSSDMATKGLRMKRAMIVGQAAPGIPLWRCDDEASKWPGIPYVVFPGNVGGEDALLRLVTDWRLDTP